MTTQFQTWAIGTSTIIEQWANDRGYDNSIDWRMADRQVNRQWPLWHTRACWVWGHQTGDSVYCQRLAQTYSLSETDPVIKSYLEAAVTWDLLSRATVPHTPSLDTVMADWAAQSVKDQE